jgi:predicted negative regulator of RcsB-dependent stress response
MVLAYQWKAEQIVESAGRQPAAGTTADEPPLTPAQLEKRQAQAAARKAEAQKYLALAVAAGKVALVDQSAAKGDVDLARLARLIGPMARESLGDSSLAGLIWLGASKRITAAAPKAECLIEAADVAVNDLATPEAAKAAKGYLDAAAAQLGADAARPGPITSRLKRVWGDYFALTGDGKAARKAYIEAASLVESRRTNAERTAWAGAHGRSTEQFIKAGELDRAAAQIRQWQDEFPADRITGYVTLLYARYWAAREMYAQAIALAGQLATVNSDSAYVDQIQVLAADCHLATGSPDKAIQTLRSLLKDQPGSPMVPQVKKRIAQLQADQAAGVKKPRKPAAPAPE